MSTPQPDGEMRPGWTVENTMISTGIILGAGMAMLGLRAVWYWSKWRAKSDNYASAVSTAHYEL